MSDRNNRWARAIPLFAVAVAGAVAIVLHLSGGGSKADFSLVVAAAFCAIGCRNGLAHLRGTAEVPDTTETVLRGAIYLAAAVAIVWLAVAEG